MSSSREFKTPFYCNQYYHLVFKSIDGLLLFNNDDNRTFFLQRFSFFLDFFFDCYAWCQLDNHVHFIVNVKTKDLLKQAVSGIPDVNKTVAMKKFLSIPSDNLLIDELIERQINSFMVSYTNAYNRMFQRTGGLFQFFRRSSINEEAHLQQAIIYVHANAQKHRLINDYRNYPHNSFKEIVNGKSLLVDTKAVLNFFGGLEQFIKIHNQQVAYFYAADWPSSKIEVD